MLTPTPRQPQPAPLPPGSPRHTRTAAEPTASAPDTSSQTVLQQRLQGAFLTIIGLAGLLGGVLFSIEAPRFTPVPVVFLTFWLVMVIVGKILFAGLGKLRAAGVGAPAPQQVRAAAAVAGIVVAVGMMGFAATTAGTGNAAAAPCPGGGPATCGPTGPELTFTPPPAQTTAPGGQQGQQDGQDQQGIATSPSQGGDNGPGIQAQTPEFGTPGQQAPNIPGNEQPGHGSGQQQGQQPQGNGQGQQNQSPVQTTAPGGPQQSGQQQPGQQTPTGQPSSPTVTVTKTESQCAVPGAGNGAGTPGGRDSGDSTTNGGGTGPGNSGGEGEDEEGAPSWAYLVGEVSVLMAGRRGRKAGPLNPDGSAPTNDMIPNDQVDGENYKEWTTPDGKRTFILSENKDAPSQYRFNINEVDRPAGGSVDVNDDGSLSTYDRDGNEVNRFTPWAYDTKTGEKIPTSYTRTGDDLIQTINRPEGNDNPILADPPGDDLADSLAVLQGSTLGMGPYTPDQQAVRARAAEAQANIDRRQSEQAVQAPLLSAVNQATQPPAPVLNVGEAVDQVEQQELAETFVPPGLTEETPLPPVPHIGEALDAVEKLAGDGFDEHEAEGVDADEGEDNDTELDAAWDKYLPDDVSSKLREFFIEGIHPVSISTGGHPGKTHRVITMSDGSKIRITDTSTPQAGTIDTAYQIENSPFFGNIDIDPSTGSFSRTLTGAEEIVRDINVISTVAMAFPAANLGSAAGKAAAKLIESRMMAAAVTKFAEGATAAQVIQAAQAAARNEAVTLAQTGRGAELGLSQFGARMMGDTRITGKIPESWVTGPARKKGGIRFAAGKGNEGVRIDKGVPGHEKISQRVDHVVVNYGGRILDANGKPITAPNPAHTFEAHIPLEVWLKWRAWNHP